MSDSRMDLVVRKVGGQFCLFTSDGTRKLGCHPTEKEAYAQEAAIKARQAAAEKLVSRELIGATRAGTVLALAAALEDAGGDEAQALGLEFIRLGADAFVAQMGCSGVSKMWDSFGGSFTTCVAKANFAGDVNAFCGALKGAAGNCGLGRSGGSVRFDMGDINVADGSFETLQNGNVVKWIPLADIGEKWINGGHEFDITPELVAQGIKNFEGSGKAPLPITFGHLDESGAPARAWINDIASGPPQISGLEPDGRPWGKVEFLKDTWSAIQKGEYKFFSLEFYPNDVDGKGNEIGFRFDGGAILNKPFFPIRVDQSAKHGGASCVRLSRFTGGPGRKEGSTMTDAEKAEKEKAEAAEKERLEKERKSVRIDGDKVTLSKAQFDQMKKDADAANELRADLATSRAEKESVEGRIHKLEQSRKADKIRSAVKSLQDQGFIVQLGDFVLKSDIDCFEWLATCPFGVSTAEGLQKLAEDSEASAHLPRVKLGGEKSGGTDRVPPADLSTEAGRNEAVRRQVAQLKRDYSPEELNAQMRRRKTDLEGLARHLLAGDHPDRRKELLEKK